MSDLIKREDAIEELADYMYEIALLKADGRLDTMEHYLNRAKAMLKRIPSADRPSGEWIPSDSFDEWYGRTCECSVCGNEFLRFNFCPNCGARMKGARDD